MAASRLPQGVDFGPSQIEACAVRAKPIVLTGVAAMTGAFFILDHPIFNGLAVALIFGTLVSTIFTLVVIPFLYYGLLAAKARRLAGNVTARCPQTPAAGVPRNNLRDEQF